MLQAIENNLFRGIKLLKNISDEEYINTSIAPYNSSIGGHIRHILDVFDCIFEGLESENINLMNRKRDENSEKYTKNGIEYCFKIIQKLRQLEGADVNKIIKVTDDLGTGVFTTNCTLASVLIQAHSHAIHHFASVGYIITQLEIQLPDDDFGCNPSTPKIISK